MKSNSNSINMIFSQGEIWVIRLFLLGITLMLFFVGGRWLWEILYLMPSPNRADNILACLPAGVMLMLGTIVLSHISLED